MLLNILTVMFFIYLFVYIFSKKEPKYKDNYVSRSQLKIYGFPNPKRRDAFIRWIGETSAFVLSECKELAKKEGIEIPSDLIALMDEEIKAFDDAMEHARSLK